MNHTLPADLKFVEPLAGLLEQAGVLDGHRHLTGHVLQGLDIAGVEGRLFGGLHIQRAKDALANNKGQGDFGAGVGEQGIVEADRFQPNV